METGLMAVHTVVQGEFLARIAAKHGFTDPMVVWEREENKGLREAGRTPMTLAPGDSIFVPDLAERELSRSTETRHTVTVTRTTSVLRLVLQRLGAHPVAGAVCTVTFGTASLPGTTDSAGKLELELPPLAESGELRIKAVESTLKDIRIPLLVGHLEPVSEIGGQEARLNNLGYRAGTRGDPRALAFRSAVEEFQCDERLGVDGICGPQTQKKLRAIHGC